MGLKSDLEQARAEADALLELGEKHVATLALREAMRRNLSKAVRRLDRLVEVGGADRALAKPALRRWRFSVDAE